MGTIISTNVQEVLGAPKYVFPSGLVFIGYPDEDLPLRPHLPLNDIVHRNRYNIPTDAEVNTFSREWDAQWDEVNPTRTEKLEEKGIRNFAQAVTLGHYTPQFIESKSKKLIANTERVATSACWKIDSRRCPKPALQRPHACAPATPGPFASTGAS